MRAFSIKRRIMVAVAATELILVVSLLFFTSYVMRRTAIQSFDTALHGRAISVAALVRYSEGPHPELQFDSALLPEPLVQSAPDLFRIEDAGGRLLGSSNPEPRFPTEGLRNSWEFSFHGVTYRALRLFDVPVLDSEENTPSRPEKLTVFYASSTQEMDRTLGRAFLRILVAGILLFSVSVYISIGAIRQGLFPLSDLAASTDSTTPADWNLKIPASAANVVEIAPLTRAMSRMVDTLHAAFQQQRDFTSNAAHELKTPVAILKSTLQSLLQEPRTGEVYRSGIADALSDVARLESLLHSMLRLSRAEQHAFATQELSEVDVVGTCEAAIARLAPLAQNRQTTVSLSTPPEALTVRAEPEDLEIVWSNLIENAVRYSPPSSEVRITAARCNGSVLVTVDDTGPGIPAAEISSIFERFHRGDQSRSRETGGYGLGLAIAKAFVERYGGSIRASSNEPKGTRIGVELPISYR